MTTEPTASNALALFRSMTMRSNDWRRTSTRSSASARPVLLPRRRFRRSVLPGAFHIHTAGSATASLPVRMAALQASGAIEYCGFGRAAFRPASPHRTSIRSSAWQSAPILVQSPLVRMSASLRSTIRQTASGLAPSARPCLASPRSRPTEEDASWLHPMTGGFTISRLAGTPKEQAR